jgi:hypothetical protein
MDAEDSMKNMGVAMSSFSSKDDHSNLPDLWYAYI